MVLGIALESIQLVSVPEYENIMGFVCVPGEKEIESYRPDMGGRILLLCVIRFFSESVFIIIGII